MARGGVDMRVVAGQKGRIHAAEEEHGLAMKEARLLCGCVFPSEDLVTTDGRIDYMCVNVDTLEERIQAKSKLTIERLQELRIIKGRTSKLKVLGRGELTKPLTVYAHRFTQAAQKKIEEAGGKVKVV
jgi:ribosomal protein L15